MAVARPMPDLRGAVTMNGTLVHLPATLFTDPALSATSDAWPEQYGQASLPAQTTDTAGATALVYVMIPR